MKLSISMPEIVTSNDSTINNVWAMMIANYIWSFLNVGLTPLGLKLQKSSKFYEVWQFLFTYTGFKWYCKCFLTGFICKKYRLLCEEIQNLGLTLSISYWSSIIVKTDIYFRQMFCLYFIASKSCLVCWLSSQVTISNKYTYLLYIYIHIYALYIWLHIHRNRWC